MIIPLQFDTAYIFDGGIARGVINGEKDLIDKKGDIVVRRNHGCIYGEKSESVHQS